MALVSAGGMGEAVLGYGADDGIASETDRDGGGVFVGRLTGGGGKDIRLVAAGGGKDIRLVAAGGLRQNEGKVVEGRRGRGVLMGEPEPSGEGDANRREVGRVVQHHLLNVGLDSDLISKAARLANGSTGGQLDNSADNNTDSPVQNGADEVFSAEEGSHTSDPASPGDRLVEMVIQCLDDKVGATLCTDIAQT